MFYLAIHSLTMQNIFDKRKKEKLREKQLLEIKKMHTDNVIFSHDSITIFSVFIFQRICDDVNKTERRMIEEICMISKKDKLAY